LELKKAVKLIEKEYEILSFSKPEKTNNPKYKNSKYKLAYLDLAGKDNL
jgi:hypothetical protein